MSLKSIITAARWILVPAAILVCAFLFWRVREADKALVLLRAENEQRRKQIDELVGQLQADSGDRKRLNEALVEANRRLARQDSLIVEQTRLLAVIAEQRVAAVPALAPGPLAQETTKELKIEPSAVRDLDTVVPSLSTDGLVFTLDAGRVNLQELIRGHAAIAELDLANQRITGLLDQVTNFGAMNVNLEGIVGNKDKELMLASERAGLRERELQKEVTVEKTRGRKGKFIWGLGGVVLGVVLALL